LLLVKAEVFQADDEGSIPFTRSIFRIKDLSEIIRELNTQLKVLGVTLGVTNVQIWSCTRESKTTMVVHLVRARGSQVKAAR
jgi:hypothetical protein